MAFNPTEQGSSPCIPSIRDIKMQEPPNYDATDDKYVIKEDYHYETRIDDYSDNKKVKKEPYYRAFEKKRIHEMT